MNAILISIGDELLIGQIVNTNVAWLGTELTRMGIVVSRTETVGDTIPAITTALASACTLADVVIVTGGIGPTHDDLTRQAVCTLLHCTLDSDPGQMQRIEERFHDRGIPVNKRSRTQAEYPSACQPLPNLFGNAVGFTFRLDKATVFVLPGVPSEMTGMFRTEVRPHLHQSSQTITQQTFLLFGVAESILADTLAALYPLLGNGVSLAFLPSDGLLRLRAMCHGEDAGDLARYNEVLQIIRRDASRWILAETDEPVAATLGAALLKHGLRIALAESCTGGMIGELITAIPGSSRYFTGSFTAYANSAKQELLGVPPDAIAEHGAVSRKVAGYMAQGALKALKADLSLSVTGIAGPDGGTPEKPVGTVCIGLASGDNVLTFQYLLGTERDVVRRRAANMAIILALRYLADPGQLKQT